MYIQQEGYPPWCREEEGTHRGAGRRYPPVYIPLPHLREELGYPCTSLCYSPWDHPDIHPLLLSGPYDEGCGTAENDGLLGSDSQYVLGRGSWSSLFSSFLFTSVSLRSLGFRSHPRHLTQRSGVVGYMAFQQLRDVGWCTGMPPPVDHPMFNILAVPRSRNNTFLRFYTFNAGFSGVLHRSAQRCDVPSARTSVRFPSAHCRIPGITIRCCRNRLKSRLSSDDESQK